MKKKLIEVALPLESINAESAREKSIRFGHPSTLHLWWARRPLAACRAVLFAQLVDDPSSHPEKFPTEEEQNSERERLFDLIRELVKWENINDDELLERARAEIRKSAPPGGLPQVLDPFAGGGSIPLEAQRLGMEAHAADLNPVAVLINKALIEIPPRFASMPPVHPKQQKRLLEKRWRGAEGLAEDIQYYGTWMRDKAEELTGHLYPKAHVSLHLLSARPDLRKCGVSEGDELTVIAWLWARTVRCPNPACGIHTPLLTSFAVSTKKGKEFWLRPQIEKGEVSLSIATKPPPNYRKPKKGLKRGTSGVFECASCGTVTTRDYVAEEGVGGRLGKIPIATVAESPGGRVYLPADITEYPTDFPEPNVDFLEVELADNPRDLWCRNFGLLTPADLFSKRQLATLQTFSDLVLQVQEMVRETALANSQWSRKIDKGNTLEDYATEYGIAVATYLAFALDKALNLWSSLASWMSDRGAMRETFARQALPMVWDFAEANPFSNSGGNFNLFIKRIADTVNLLPKNVVSGKAIQADATQRIELQSPMICTDPPYYDNIGYADLSDFFYVWLRKNLQTFYPMLFSTLTTPKSTELIAAAYRFDGTEASARDYFEEGLRKSFEQMRIAATADYPVTVFYAFKQAEVRTGSVASTGWETMLEGLIGAGFSITGTWPVRTESSGRVVAIGTNALASSIVLVCRRRAIEAPMTTRRQFLTTLRKELPSALIELQKGDVAPVDLAQASIGPGMAVFSRYGSVFEADGSSMRVRTALAMINQVLDEFLSEQEGEYDPDTRWAVTWYEQYGFSSGPFGDAETLSKAKNTSVVGMVQAGILGSGGGKVRLLHRDELEDDWDPAVDRRLTVWEVTQHLIRTMQDHGEEAAAELRAKVGPLADAAHDLAYRLYTICERKGWAQEAIPYNSLVVSWSDIGRLARDVDVEPIQGRLL